MGIHLGTLKVSYLSFLNFCLFCFLFVFTDVFYLGLASNLYNFNIVIWALFIISAYFILFVHMNIWLLYLKFPLQFLIHIFITQFLVTT